MRTNFNRTILLGVIVAATPALLAAQAADTSGTHTVVRGETLWALAQRYMGDPFRWPEIYRNNTELIKDPHWIYPGQVLRISGKAPNLMAHEVPPMTPPPNTAGEVVQSVQQTVSPAPSTGPTVFSPRAAVTQVETRSPIAVIMPPRGGGAVLSVTHLEAPWLDRLGGPLSPGRIISSAEVPGIAKAYERARYQEFDQVLITPPVGSVAAEHDRFLIYDLGPIIPDLGQVVVPTGIAEVIRAPREGEPAVARISRMFTSVDQDQRLTPLDTTTPAVPSASAELDGKVVWASGQPVLPTLYEQLIIVFPDANPARVGDDVNLFRIAEPPKGGVDSPSRETVVGKARVVRISPMGATAIVTHIEQPNIAVGTLARMATNKR